jgi:hypothetical protein
MLNAVVRRLAMETICTAGVVVVLLCVYGGARAWLHARIDGRGIEDVRSAIAGRPLLLPGKRLTVRGFDLAKHPYSFLIVTSPGCAYCVNSAPFHRTLVAAARERRIPLFVVIPGARGDSSFLSSSGLHNAEVIRWEDLSRRPNATPSVVLVNAGGVIRRIWDGELARDGQSEVLAAIRDPSRVTSPLRKLTSGESMLTPGSLRVLSSMSVVHSNLSTRRARLIFRSRSLVCVPRQSCSMTGCLSSTAQGCLIRSVLSPPGV